MPALAESRAHINGTDGRVRTDKEAAIEQPVAERDVIPCLPDVAILERAADIGFQERRL